MIPSSTEPDPITELLARPVPKHLWHYTSYGAFQGIVESKAIFASDLRYLNDVQEFIHAKDLAFKLADELTIPSLPGSPGAQTVKQAVNLAFNTGPLRADRFQVMVASFSEAEDQLSQWRGYSGASSGISVSMNLAGLRPPPDLATAAVFAPCVYDDSKKTALLTYALSRIIDTVEQWSTDVKAAIEADPRLFTKISTPMELGPPHVAGPDFGTRLQQALQKVIYDLARICPLLKHSSFSEEKEWRLVLPVFPGKQLQNPKRFRAAKDTLVPYIAHPLCDPDSAPPVNGVVLGPGSHPDAISAVSAFLQERRLRIMPQTSTVPYRAT